MKKFVKKKSNFGKRLVKTTTFTMSLFVVALMLSSSGASAVSVNSGQAQINNNITTPSRSLSMAPAFSKEQVSYNSKMAVPTLNGPKDSRVDFILKYHGAAAYIVTAGAVVVWEAAIRLTPTELTPYNNFNFTKAKMYFYNSLLRPVQAALKIYDGYNATSPGALLEQVNVTFPTNNTIYTVTLPTPIKVNATHDYWVSWRINQTNAADYPIVADAGPGVAGKGCWYYDAAGGWYDLAADPGFNLNWYVEAVVTGGWLHDAKVVSIDVPVSGTATGPVAPKATVMNNGTNPETFPVNMKIGSVGTTNIFSYGWEDSISPGIFSSIWGQLVTAGTTTYTWKPVGAGSSPSNTPHEGSWQAMYNSYSYSSGSACRLYMNNASLNFLATGLQTITMKFWMYHDNGYSANTLERVEVQVSTDKVNWATVGSFIRYSATNSWVQHTIDLSAYANQPTVYLGFWAYSQYGNNMFIDDFQVIGSGILWNQYNQTVNVSLAAGATTQVTFPTWNMPPWHNPAYQNVSITYAINAKANLVGDQYAANNEKQNTFTLYYPFLYDVKIVRIDSPQGGFKQDFTGVTPPALPSGWATNYPAQWITSATANAGGTAPEAEFLYSSLTGDFRLYTLPFSTVGMTSVNLQFRHMVNHYTTPYTLKVETSTDGVTWSSAWSISPTASIPATLVTVPLTTANGIGSPTFQLSFTLSGYSYNINYWYVDNIGWDSPAMAQVVKATIANIGQYPLRDFFVNAKIGEKVGSNVIIEYNESVGITTWLNPGDTRTLTYVNWTPANLLSPQTSGLKNYSVILNSKNTPDNNTVNNIMTKTIALVYTHDVYVDQITSPAPVKGDRDRDLLFSQRPFLPTEGWTFRTSASTYTCQDNFAHLDKYIKQIEFYGVCLQWTGSAWIAGNPANLRFDIKFYKNTSNYPGTVVATFSNLTIPYVNYLLYSTYQSYRWTYNLPAQVGLEDGWVSVYATTTPDWFLWAGSPQGNLNMYQQGASAPQIAGDCAFNLSGNGTLPPQPPPVSVYVAKGAKPIAAIVKNSGTFIQNNLVAYADIFEWISNPNGTQVYSDNVTGINLIALGGQATVNFAKPYDFQLEGIYGLIVSIPLVGDNVPSNNVKKLGIGCDATPPVTTISLNPAAPDGKNGWYVHDVTATLTATDPVSHGVASGVASIKYKVDNGSEMTYTAPFKVTTDKANHTIYYWAVDKVGNKEADKTKSFSIDKTPPMVILEKEVGLNKVVYTATPTDNTSGMWYVQFYLNIVLQFNASAPGPYIWTLSPVPHVNGTVKANAVDRAGNNASTYQSSSQSQPYNQQSQQQQQQQSTPEQQRFTQNR